MAPPWVRLRSYIRWLLNKMHDILFASVSLKPHYILDIYLFHVSMVYFVQPLTPSVSGALK